MTFGAFISAKRKELIKNTFPTHGANGRHHKAERCVSAACRHHLRGQPLPGLCRGNSYSEVIA